MTDDRGTGDGVHDPMMAGRQACTSPPTDSAAAADATRPATEGEPVTVELIGLAEESDDDPFAERRNDKITPSYPS